MSSWESWVWGSVTWTSFTEPAWVDHQGHSWRWNLIPTQRWSISCSGLKRNRGSVVAVNSYELKYQSSLRAWLCALIFSHTHCSSATARLISGTKSSLHMDPEWQRFYEEFYDCLSEKKFPDKLNSCIKCWWRCRVECSKEKDSWLLWYNLHHWGKQNWPPSVDTPPSFEVRKYDRDLWADRLRSRDAGAVHYSLT